MTYKEYRDARQKEFNELPIFFAFSDKQLEEEMNKRGLTINDTDKIYRFGNVGFYLRSDSDKIKAWLHKEDPLDELMKDYDFAVSAFRYEMDNHEYAINYYQGDWEVCSCFVHTEWGEDKNYEDYLTEAEREDLIPAYKAARKSHYKAAEDWF